MLDHLHLQRCEMRKLAVIIAIVLFALTGCVSRYATFQHPETKDRQYCSNKGWGWLGAPIALSEHEKCVEYLKDKGYMEEKIN